jgi:hypothetical protein
MPDAANSSLIITVLSFNGTNFGIAQNISVDLPAGSVPIQNQGQLGFGAIGIVSKGCLVTIIWIAGAGSKLFERGTKGDMAYTTLDAVGGQTQARPIGDMVALDGKLIHADRTVAVYQQTFMRENDDGTVDSLEQ